MNRLTRVLYKSLLKETLRHDKHPQLKAALVNPTLLDSLQEKRKKNASKNTKNEINVFDLKTEICDKIYGQNGLYYVPEKHFTTILKEEFRKTTGKSKDELEKYIDLGFSCLKTLSRNYSNSKKSDFLQQILQTGEYDFRNPHSKTDSTKQTMKLEVITDIADIQPGHFLLSHPLLLEETWCHSIILITEVNSTGYLGLVLNIPIENQLRAKFADVDLQNDQNGENEEQEDDENQNKEIETSDDETDEDIVADEEHIILQVAEETEDIEQTTSSSDQSQRDKTILAEYILPGIHSVSYSNLKDCVLQFGGPVHSLNVIHPYNIKGAVKLYPDLDVYYGGDIDELNEAAKTSQPNRNLVMFHGAAKWGRKQLDNEIKRGFWIPIKEQGNQIISQTMNLTDETWFSDSWNRVMRALGGEYHNFQHFPTGSDFLVTQVHGISPKELKEKFEEASNEDEE